MVGKILGHYEIIEPLGSGGMGEVYRARDTQLDRDVAIKVLPEDFATDQDRLARFERAKLLASLNHANIATIHGLGDSEGVRFIAMELVDGETSVLRHPGASKSKKLWTSPARSPRRSKQRTRGDELLQTDGSVFPISLSPDGQQLLLHEMIGDTQRRRIGIMSIEGDRTVSYPLDDGQSNRRSPMVSPDGRWVAYVSTHSGRDEVYASPFPGFGTARPVSNAGGHSPMWGRDETELFYLDDERMIVAQVRTEPGFRVLARETLFPNTYVTGLGYRTLYDYDRENDRFLMVKNMAAEAQEVQFTVVVNWFKELKRLAPPGR